MKLLIYGQGYVGLPLAQQAVRAGMDVMGCDVSEERVRALNAGRSPVGDLSDDDLATMLFGGFRAVTSPEPGYQPDVIVICVPTPLSEFDGPDLSMVCDAASQASLWLDHGTLVVLESTSYPGTTENVVRPILETGGLTAGKDFALAFSPERIDPGNPVYGLANTPKVVGGITPECTRKAAEFYSLICKEVVQAKSAREAEMAKLLENTYRHVNIALVNEMAIFCHEMGIDLRDAIRCAATKPFGFQAFQPGPGVGGHCIPIDPNYLSHEVRRQMGYPFRFVELAQEINNRMPAYVVTRAAELLNSHAKPLNGSTVLLLGVTYKPDIADQRESPAPHIARRLRRAGAIIRYSDPHVPQWAVDGHSVRQQETPAGDLIIVLQPHRQFDLNAVSRGLYCPLVLDTSGWVPVSPIVTQL